jgi:catechol-2,3-dioxygenase
MSRLTFTDASDHLVSEAIYFNDPEGNGIEVYADRSCEAWVWSGSHWRDAMLMGPCVVLARVREHRLATACFLARAVFTAS